MGKKLYRNQDNKWIGGVMSGLGDYLDIDPVILRLVAVLTCMGSFGSLAILYLICMVIIPSKEDACDS